MGELTELSANLRGIADKLETGPVAAHVAQDYIDVFTIAAHGMRDVFLDTAPVFDDLFIAVGDKVVKRWDWSVADVRRRIEEMV